MAGPIMKVRTGLRAPAPQLRSLFDPCRYCGARPHELCTDEDGWPFVETHYETNMSRVVATRMFAPLPTSERN